jgi:hypothetical protein
MKISKYLHENFQQRFVLYFCMAYSLSDRGYNTFAFLWSFQMNFSPVSPSPLSRLSQAFSGALFKEAFREAFEMIEPEHFTEGVTVLP